MPRDYMRWKADFVKQVPEFAKTQCEAVLSVFIRCTYTIPKSASKKEQAAYLCGSKADYVPVGDSDNLGKSVLDALQDAGVYKNDRQVVILTVCKEYGVKEGVFVRITDLTKPAHQ